MELSQESLDLVLIGITGLFAVLLAIGLWLGRKAVGLLEGRVSAQVASQVSAFVDSAITAGIHLADEYAHKKARGLLAQGPATPEQKLEVAKSAARSLAPAALADIGDDKLEMMVEAKLQSMRPWRPAPSSVPPMSFSIPPPAAIPNIKTPLPPKRRA